MPIFSLAEVNLGIICSCLPVLPIFYKHMIKTLKNKISKPSTYYELEAVWRSDIGVERMQSNDAKQMQIPDRRASEPALHRQYLGFNGGYTKDPWHHVLSDAYHDPNGHIRSGGGIMKTVELERVEESFTSEEESDFVVRKPSNVVLPSASPTGSARLPV